VLLGGILLITLSTARESYACPFYNPVCWWNEAADFVRDKLNHAGKLLVDILHADGEAIWDDLVEIFEEDLVCDLLDVPTGTIGGLLIANGISADVDDTCTSTYTLQLLPNVHALMQQYFRSPIAEVRVYGGCDVQSGAAAITIGESIYFAEGYFPPTCEPDPDNCGCVNGIDVQKASILAHELIHVMQSREEGFKDFICKFHLECGLVEDSHSCDIEQEAFLVQAMVYEDVGRDQDGIFTCPLGECPGETGDLTWLSVYGHKCGAEITLCGLESGPDYCAGVDNCPNAFNPDQLDSDGDGRGDVCDEDCPGEPDPLPYEDLDQDCVFDSVDNCVCDQETVDLLTNCDPDDDPGGSDPDVCPPGIPCLDFSNSDQADFDGDLAGDVCDTDDDNDGLEDEIEQELGTDPLDADTDDDGLTDFDEVNVYLTDPLVADTDGDAVGDGEEVSLGTDPLDPDSDDDGLNDGLELTYGTDPLNADSDGDGLPDGQDVGWLQAAIRALSALAFKGADSGLKTAMLVMLDTVERRVALEQISAAMRVLDTLHRRLDSCGTLADRDDWIVDCEAQIEMRSLVELLATNVAS
jgi:hypothetical protein